MNRVISDNYVTGDNIYLRELQNFFFEVLGMMSITHYGAIGDGRRDNYGPLQVAIDDAHRRGVSFLYVPYGRFIYTGELINIGDIIFIGNPHAHIVNIRTGQEIEIKQFGWIGDNYYNKQEIDEMISESSDVHALSEDIVLLANTPIDMESGFYYTGEHKIYLTDDTHLMFDSYMLVYWDNDAKRFVDDFKYVRYDDTIMNTWVRGNSNYITTTVINDDKKVPTSSAVCGYVNDAINAAITQAIGGAY